MRNLKGPPQVLTAAILAIAILALLRLAPANTAAQPLYTIYLPWLEQSSPLFIDTHMVASSIYILPRVVPHEATVRPGIPVVWTNRAGTVDFQSFWNKAPSATWRLERDQSFTVVFGSSGTFTYTVDFHIAPGNPAAGLLNGTIQVSENPAPTIRNLWVTKKASRTVVPVGDTLEYDIFLDNVGLVDIRLDLFDIIPPQTSFVDVRSGPLGGTPRPSPVYSPNAIFWAGTVRHSRDASTGELSGYPSEWFKLTVRVDAMGPFANTVQVNHGPITMAASAQVVGVTPTPTPTPSPTATPPPPVPTPTAVIIP